MDPHLTPAPQPPARPLRPAAPRQVRLGVVRGGALIHEELLRPGATLHVGPALDAEVLVELDGLPPRFPLVVPRGGDHVLRLCAPMGGAVRLADGLHSVASLRALAPAGAVLELPLPDEVRAKIVLGEVTVLFQLVAPPAVERGGGLGGRYRPRLFDPRDGLFHASLSSASAVGAALGLLALLVEPAVIAEPPPLPERVVQIAFTPPPPVEEPLPLPLPEEAAAPEAPTVAKVRPSRKPPAPGPSPDDGAAGAPAARGGPHAGRAAELADHAQILGLLRHTNPGLGGGDDALDVIAAELGRGAVAGATRGAGADVGLRVGGGGRIDASVGPLDGPGRGGVEVAVERAAAVQAPRPSRVVAEPIDAAPQHADALSRALRGYGAQVKACYDQALKADPGLAGRLELELSIAGGKVQAARVEGELGQRSPALASCVSSRARRWAFDPAVEDTVLVPYSFTAG
jgi:hypothetical protein